MMTIPSPHLLLFLLAWLPSYAMFDFRQELPPITESRYDSPKIDLPPPEPVSREDYLKLAFEIFEERSLPEIQQFIDKEGKGDENFKRNAIYHAYEAALINELNTKGHLDTYENSPRWLKRINWVAVAIASARNSYQYQSNPEIRIPNGDILAQACRALWLLKDNPALNQSVKFGLIDWLHLLDTRSVEKDALEYDFNNITVADAYRQQIICLLTDLWWPEGVDSLAANTPEKAREWFANTLLPANEQRAEYANAIWQVWRSHRDLQENTTHYNILTLEIMRWWADCIPYEADMGYSDTAAFYAETDGLFKIAHRLLEYATPLGPMPNFGDSTSWFENPGSWITHMETFAKQYNDGRFRWIANRTFDYFNNHFLELDRWGSPITKAKRNLLETVIAMDADLAPRKPESNGRILTRQGVRFNPRLSSGSRLSFTNEEIPAKATLRTGWNRYGKNSSSLMIELCPPYSHSHFDTGGISSYISNGVILLTDTPYLIRGHQHHNTFVVNNTDDTNDPFSRDLSVRNTGAIANTRSIPEGTAIHVRFRARALSEDVILTVGRAWGYSNRIPVEITSEWKEYRAGPIDLTHDTTSILFCAIARPPIAHTQPVDASFLLDDVHIELPDSDEPVILNSDFENMLSPINQWYGTLKGKGADFISAEMLPDGGYALRVDLSTGWRGNPNTASCEVLEHTYDESADLGVIRIRMPNYVKQPVTVEREFFLLGDAGLLVRDQLTASETINAKIGPAWQFTHTYGALGKDWINACQVTIPAAQIFKRSFLTQFSNSYRPFGIDALDDHTENQPTLDVLLRFPDNDGAQTIVDDVTIVDNRQNTAARRVWRQQETVLKPGDVHTFNTLLIPHHPKRDDKLKAFAETIQYIHSDSQQAVITIGDTGSSTVTVYGINHTGNAVSHSVNDQTFETTATHYSITFFEGAPTAKWASNGASISVSKAE